jgi:hypothetical protein
MRSFAALFLGALPFAAAYPGEANSVKCAGGDQIIWTPTYGTKDAVFSVCASIKIKGTVQKVSNAILDFPKYKKWNTFIINAVPPTSVKTPADLRVGMGIAFTSVGIPAGSNNTATDTITFLEPPYFAAWKNEDYDEYIGHSEHVLIFAPLPNGYSQFTHWQTQLGAAATNALPLKADFQREFSQEASDLKVYVESKK